MKNTLLALLFALICFNPLILLADNSVITSEESPYEVAERLQNHYETVTSLSFHFSQDTESGLGGRPQTGSGEAFFLKEENGGKMRWNYFTPEKQVLVSDGKIFSMYFEHLKQMITAPATSMESDLTYAFFTGVGSIPKDFLIFAPDENVGMDSTNGSFKVIKIVPKEVQSQVKDIHLWVTDESLIQRIEIRDHFDTITILNLNKIIVDALSNSSHEELDSLFEFTPPEGTEIIEQ